MDVVSGVVLGLPSHYIIIAIPLNRGEASPKTADMAPWRIRTKISGNM